MSDQIKVPYGELRMRAKTIHEQAEMVRVEISNLDALIVSLQWMGQRASSFQAMWANALPEMRNWAALLDSFAEDLENQAQRIEMVDSANP